MSPLDSSLTTSLHQNENMVQHCDNAIKGHTKSQTDTVPTSKHNASGTYGDDMRHKRCNEKLITEPAKILDWSVGTKQFRSEKTNSDSCTLATTNNCTDLQIKLRD